MFIVIATKPRDPAPAERNVLGRPENMSLLRSLGEFFVTGIYRHFVPLGLGRKTFSKRQGFRILLHRAHGGIGQSGSMTNER